MKYTVEIEIDLPKARVIELFDDAEKMTQWQPDLIDFEHLSGDLGQPGAKSKLVYRMGKRVVEMVETITENNLPDELKATYKTKGVFNKIANRFEEIDENKTLWISENVFKFSGFVKLIGPFIKSSFPKQTLQFMNQFKTYAEHS